MKTIRNILFIIAAITTLSITVRLTKNEQHVGVETGTCYYMLFPQSVPASVIKYSDASINNMVFRILKKDEDGNVTGFQFKVRLPYYRGIFLSQIRPGTLYVDGEKIEKDEIIWNINGEDFTNEEMAADFQRHWSVTTPAVLKVKKAGGLAQGYHDLKYGFCFTSSYMPPIIQAHLDPDQENMVFMPEFGHHVNERRLLIV